MGNVFSAAIVVCHSELVVLAGIMGFKFFVCCGGVQPAASLSLSVPFSIRLYLYFISAIYGRSAFL